MQKQSLSHSVSFKDFLLKDKRNKMILWVTLAIIIVQFCIFKYYYPYPSFIHGDSFNYIYAAAYNLSINTYPVGYSNFLRLFSVFTKSDTILVWFQYLFVQASALTLLMTLFYFYQPSRITQIILLIFISLNPLLLHLGNLISSDCIFLSLSFLWFGSLLWLLNKASLRLILVHSLVLFVAFTCRYNALLYPFISVVVIIVTKTNYKTKALGVLVCLLPCASFVTFTTLKYKELTGLYQFSPFSGWQWANNAMYAYRYVDSSEREPVNPVFRKLDKMVREYFDSTRDTKKHYQETLQASTVYMWDPRLTLFQYRESVFKGDSTASEMEKWSSMGPFYKSYGIHIIKKYPIHFLKYFIWPNTKKYYAPPIEFLESYNSWKFHVTDDAKKWFGYKSNFVKLRAKTPVVSILDFYPILSGIINFVMLCFLICYYILKRQYADKHFNSVVVLSGTFWIMNAFFTISASSAALRFQSFPILVTTISVGLFIDWMTRIIVNYQPIKESAKIKLEIQQSI